MTGFIVINKGAGVSSAREVAKVKRVTKVPCGHMGTLDPMAEGVLPVGVGNACRLFDYFLSKRKTYIADFVFGKDYDTLDTTGTLLSQNGLIPTEEQINAVLPYFTGDIMQVPPKFSAKSVDGVRGYRLARSGVEFELPARQVTVYSLEILGQLSSDCFRFKIECGGGTYVRSLARDIAEKLGTVAAMSALVRQSSGPFTLENSVKSQDLTCENFYRYLIPTDKILPFESFYANAGQAKKLFNGLTAECDLQDGLYKIYNENGEFYGLAQSENGVLKVRTKLC